MHEGGRRDTTIGAMLCENDHEWLATMSPPTPTMGWCGRSDQTEYCPVCGLLTLATPRETTC